MTEAQFLKRLRKTPREWHMHGKMIRLYISENVHNACPISVLGNKNSGRYREVAKKLKIARGLRDIIVYAADDLYIGTSKITAKQKSMRKKLLKACGLT